MDTRFGKLILLNPGGPEQEFELAKASISLGRATTSDILLNDARVSRSHASLRCEAHGVTLRDLGSANGTRLNGVVIERATLKPGDTISLGNQRLRYVVDDLSEDVGITQIDSQAQLDQTISAEFLPVAINETSTPSLVVYTGSKTWKADLANLDKVTIGRDESCTIFIDAHNISRRHAEVYLIEGGAILQDLGSTNGTWVGAEKIDRYSLQDGDVFRVGPAQLIYKRGFQEAALTMADEQLAKPGERQTVVFVPGMMGSELWIGNERIWPDVKTIFKNPEIYLYPSKAPIEPRGIVDEVVIVPNLVKQDQYNRLGDYLVEELHYRRGVDFFEFAYDWRQDVRISAQELGRLIESHIDRKPVVIIAHSLGTMVSRYYIERLGGKQYVERAILMGGPHQGAVKGLTSMLIAPEVLPFGIMGERLRQILLTFPTSFQILPVYAVGTDQHGTQINFMEDDSWLEPKYRPLLQMGCDFRSELGSTASIPYVSIFGYGIKTISGVTVVRDVAGKLQKVDFMNENTGDGSVLEQSAFLKGSEFHPVRQHHGALFVDNDVRMRLKLELTRPY